MKCDELIEDYCFDATDNQTKAVYPKADVDAAIDEMKDELNRAKVREDVLVTDNRDLMEKVKNLENLLRENAEHFKRNEAQIIENSDNEIKKLKAENERLNNLLNVWNTYKILSNTYKELKFTKRALWVARARTAHLEVKCFVHDMYDDDATAEESAKDEIMANKWYKVKLLCIKKAKEYK